MKKLLLLMLLSLFCTSSALAMALYDFNDGTNQGWTYDVFVDGTQTAGSATGWSDANNYPNSMLTDPIGDSNGSANVFTPTYAPSGFTVLQFQSPDLSSDADWQNLDYYSAQILPSFIGNDTYWANTVIVLEDQDGATRSFTNETSASVLTQGIWNLEYADVDSFLAPDITSYITQQVLFNIWIDPALDAELVFSLDDVFAVNFTDEDPGNGNGTAPVPEPSTFLLLGSGLAGIAWYRRKRK